MFGSIMSKASNYGRTNEINSKIVKQILKKAGLGKRKSKEKYRGHGKGNLKSDSSSEPVNFKKGKVKGK